MILQIGLGSEWARIVTSGILAFDQEVFLKAGIIPKPASLPRQLNFLAPRSGTLLRLNESTLKEALLTAGPLKL